MNRHESLVQRTRSLLVASRNSFWSPTARTMRGWAMAGVVVNAGITVTGAAVRLTGSGLGCPTWPKCTPDSFLPAAHPDVDPITTAIEFGNRMLTSVVTLVAVACVLAAWRMVNRRRPLVRLALAQLAGVAVQALWGGIVVRTALNPVTVSVHFLVSMAMIAAAWALYARSGEGDQPAEPLVHRAIRTLGFVLAGAVAVLLATGVVVTGTGPHSGDKAASRFDFDLEAVVKLHADLVWIVVGLTFALAFALYVTKVTGPVRQAALALIAVELAQGFIGYLQYFLAVPAVLVGLHVLGSTLVWIATLRVVFLLRTRGPLAVEHANQPVAARV